MRDGDGHVLLRLLVDGGRYDPAIVKERRAVDGTLLRTDRYVLVGELAEWPQDRTFREAWVYTGGRIVVDMPRARMIHLTRLRVARDAALTELDVPFLRAVEDGNVAEQQRIREDKQRLRDLPEAFDLSTAQTADELKARWPEGLARS